jgi:protein-tyrosine phosphatase
MHFRQWAGEYLESFAMPTHFKIRGAANFRALGWTKPNVLFRSDHLGALDESDARQIQSLGIRRVLDFRGVNERASAVCALPGVTVHSLAIEPTIVQVINDLVAAGQELSAADVVAHMQDTYRGFVRHNTHRFAQFFAHLLESNEPTVFHCTAGKDRTGFAAALVLHALGASRDEVMRDYLLTNERLKMPEGSRYGMRREVASVLFRVQPEFLDAAFETVDREYGGLEPYFKEGLGLGSAQRERLKELYLPPDAKHLL